VALSTGLGHCCGAEHQAGTLLRHSPGAQRWAEPGPVVCVSPVCVARSLSSGVGMEEPLTSRCSPCSAHAGHGVVRALRHEGRLCGRALVRAGDPVPSCPAAGREGFGAAGPGSDPRRALGLRGRGQSLPCPRARGRGCLVHRLRAAGAGGHAPGFGFFKCPALCLSYPCLVLSFLAVPCLALPFLYLPCLHFTCLYLP